MTWACHTVGDLGKLSVEVVQGCKHCSTERIVLCEERKGFSIPMWHWRSLVKVGEEMAQILNEVDAFNDQ